MLQVFIYYAEGLNIVAEIRDFRDQDANATHDHLELYTGLTGFIKLTGDLLIR